MQRSDYSDTPNSDTSYFALNIHLITSSPLPEDKIINFTENLKMKRYLTFILWVLICGAPVLSRAQETAGTYKNVPVAEFEKLIKSKPGLLLDVRTPPEVKKGTIEGSRNIDFFSENFESIISGLDKNKPVYVFCASGGRSGETMEMMKKKGFTEVYNLEGGFAAWKAAHP